MLWNFVLHIGGLDFILEIVCVSSEVRLNNYCCQHDQLLLLIFWQHNQISLLLSHWIPVQEKGMTSVLIALVGFPKNPLCLKKARNQELQIKLALKVLPVRVQAIPNLNHKQKPLGLWLMRKHWPGTLLSRTQMTVMMTQCWSQVQGIEQDLVIGW